MYKILKELEQTSSRIGKEDIILREMINKNDRFFFAVKIALDKLYTLGVKQVPISSSDGPGIKWSEFLKLVEQLHNRSLTGNAAKNAVLQMCNLANMSEWNDFYRRILIKDLKCGVSEKTVNNVIKKNKNQYSYINSYMVPVFNCQLAHDSAKHEKKLKGEKIIEVKLDGVRVITIVTKNSVSMFSRNGKELFNFQHISDELSALNNDESPFVLDGEVISSDFQTLMKQIYRKELSRSSDAILHIFDFLPLKDFEKGIYKKPQIERYKDLCSWFERFNKLNYCRVIKQEIINLDTECGEIQFKALNKNAIENGYEGIMIKDPCAPYECKRSTAWLKMKPFIEVTLSVIKVEEGTGRNIGKLGALVVEGLDDGKHFYLSVGSGFLDEQRELFWRHRDKLIGQLVEIRADVATIAQNSTTWSLRFPRFKTFRGFKPGQKI